MPADSEKRRLAIGTDDFEKLRKTGCYYVDKTGMIAELVNSAAEVSLFTRPLRFGKSLNMSMLQCFFEIGRDPALFDGLAVAEETKLCETYMGKYPVISLTLKDVEGSDFQSSCRRLAARIRLEASRFNFLRDCPKLSPEERELYTSLLKRDMDQETICGSLLDLSVLLAKHYGRKVILLIDEYDVPLQKAFYNGYYDEMVQLLRGMFGQALKTNPSLEFAVLTGCLRISKESIFTGMNNLCVLTITDRRFREYFGFTDEEVREMLDYYGLSGACGRVKEWYDGYCFGDTDIYCPWDVINYTALLRADPKARPENFWANSSGNEVVSEFVRKLDISVTAKELELLTAGETVMKEIRQELTYREMYSSAENIWSLLFMTGYLTKRGEAVGKKLPLAIPNLEIREIFTTRILDLFKEQVAQDGAMVREFCSALKNGDAGKAEELFGQYLKKTVSIRDTFVRRSLKENFYHGILLGILSFKGDWYVSSNFETGDGYGDILIETEGDVGIVIEIKYAHDGDLEKAAEQALRQIEQRRYDERMYSEGIRKVLRYGIACCRKECRVVTVT